MTDDDSPDTDSRRNRLATRRHRLRTVGVVLLVVLIAVGAAVAMTLRNHDKTSAETATHPQATTNDSGPAPKTSIGTAHKVEPPRAISHDDPMRLWIGGDSLAGSFGPALGQMAGATGVVKATIDYKVSSGLADNGIRDWYEHAQAAMAQSDPDAVVFIIGTNDASIVNSQDSNNDGVPDWEVDYGAKLERMMNTLVGGDRHRTVYWLGPPTLGDDTLNKEGYKLGRFMRAEARKFAPDVVYVDTYKLFSDHGQYSRDLSNGHGQVEEMRISDGIHFTVDGAKYLSNAIWKLLDKRWQVDHQADPSNPIDYTIAPGSNDYVPGVGHYRPDVSTQYNTTTSSSSSSDTSTTIDTSTTLSSSTTKPETSTTQSTPTTKHTGTSGPPTSTKPSTPPKNSTPST